MLYYKILLILVLIIVERQVKVLLSIMYIIVKHYVTINAYTVERIIHNEADAIALVNIYNRNNKESDIQYILTEVIK